MTCTKSGTIFDHVARLHQHLHLTGVLDEYCNLAFPKCRGESFEERWIGSLYEIYSNWLVLQRAIGIGYYFANIKFEIGEYSSACKHVAGNRIAFRQRQTNTPSLLLFQAFTERLCIFRPKFFQVLRQLLDDV